MLIIEHLNTQMKNAQLSNWLCWQACVQRSILKYELLLNLQLFAPRKYY